MPSRILIVTSGPLCRNPRPLKEALTLAAAGYEVTVLTVHETDEAARLDERLLAGSSVRLDTLRPPVTAAGRFFRRLQTWCARRAVLYTGWSPAAALGPTHALLAAARRHPADLTIVHNEAPFWIGCRLLAEGRTVAADFEDWYSEDLLESARRSRPLALLRRLERTLLRDCRYTTTTSVSLARALAETYSAPSPRVLTNSFPLQPTPPERPPRDPALVWFSQTIGPGRGLEEFIALWGSPPSVCGQLTLIGDIIPGYDRSLLDRLPAASRSRLFFHPPVAPDALPGLLAGFDIGLALEPRAPRNKDLTISNKILQYLNAGLAVIASPTAGQQEILSAAPDAGVILDNRSPPPHAALHSLLTDRTALLRAQTAARRAAETRFCWENEAPVLLHLTRSALVSR